MIMAVDRQFDTFFAQDITKLGSILQSPQTRGEPGTGRVVDHDDAIETFAAQFSQALAQGTSLGRAQPTFGTVKGAWHRAIETNKRYIFIWFCQLR